MRKLIFSRSMPHIHYCLQQHCCTANYSIFPRVWTHQWYFQIKHFASLIDFELFCCTGAASYYNSALGLSNRPFLFFAAWALCQCLLLAPCGCTSLIVFIYVLFQVPHPVDLNSVRAAVMLIAIEATAACSSNARSHAATFAPSQSLIYSSLCGRLNPLFSFTLRFYKYSQVC